MQILKDQFLATKFFNKHLFKGLLFPPCILYIEHLRFYYGDSDDEVHTKINFPVFAQEYKTFLFDFENSSSYEKQNSIKNKSKFIFFDSEAKRQEKQSSFGTDIMNQNDYSAAEVMMNDYYLKNRNSELKEKIDCDEKRECLKVEL